MGLRVRSQEKTQRTILFWAANPQNSDPIPLSEEMREIEVGLKRAEFQLEQRWAVQTRGIGRAFLEHSPQIVHFSGHRVGKGGLVLEDETEQAQLVRNTGLADLFKLFSDQIECVLLNTCYSVAQAEAIARHIPYVIDTKWAIDDSTAQKFAVGFYDALEAGKTIESAFKYGCAVQVAPTKAGLYGDHLRHHLLHLKEDATLKVAMRQVVSSSYPVGLESSLGFKLRSNGLVWLQGNDVVLLCNPHRTYFRDRLGLD